MRAFHRFCNILRDQRSDCLKGGQQFVLAYIRTDVLRILLVYGVWKVRGLFFAVIPRALVLNVGPFLKKSTIVGFYTSFFKISWNKRRKKWSLYHQGNESDKQARDGERRMKRRNGGIN